MSFEELQLPQRVLDQLDVLGFVDPTPIQRDAIPHILEGRDVIGKAETGTGKTLAFCAPMFQHIDETRGAPQSIILCPTRELAQQVAETADAVGKALGFSVALLVGGVHQGQQILSLREGAQVIVGTPGRVLDFLRERTLRLGWASYVVLDEADRMLDMGFIDDVTAILAEIPKEQRQLLMFSATVPPRLMSLTKRFMRDPITVSTMTGMATVPEIDQYTLRCHPGDKEGFVLDVLDGNPEDTCIIFCNTRRAVIDLDRTLWGLGYPAGSLHGDIDQERRFEVLDAFKDRKILILVATDVAGRGLDVDDVQRVINYDVPDEVESYVHRIGRTGRAGGKGESLTLVSRKDEDNWQRICQQTKFKIEELDWQPVRPRRQHVEEFSPRGRSGGGGRGGRPGGRPSGGRPSGGGRGGGGSRGGSGGSRGGGGRGGSGRGGSDSSRGGGGRGRGDSNRSSGGSSGGRDAGSRGGGSQGGSGSRGSGSRRPGSRGGGSSGRGGSSR